MTPNNLRPRRRRIVLALAGAGLVGVTGTACTSHAGAAAQVGPTRISTDTLDGLVDRGIAAAKTDSQSQVTDPQDLQRRQLGTLISDRLTRKLAAERGVSVSDQDVSAYRVVVAVLQYGGESGLQTTARRSGVAPQDINAVFRANALAEALGDKIAPDLTVPEAQVRQAYDQVKSQLGGKISISYAQAAPEIRRLLLSQQRAARLQPLLRAEAKKEGVSVNPRFGKWDASLLTVTAADGSISTAAKGSTAPKPILTP